MRIQIAATAINSVNAKDARNPAKVACGELIRAIPNSAAKINPTAVIKK